MALDDDGEHIVEIMGDAAGQLADRFHLLHLPYLRFRPLAGGDLVAQRGIRCGQLLLGEIDLVHAPAHVEGTESADQKNTEQSDDRGPAQPLPGADGGRQAGLQHGVLVLPDIGDDGAKAIHVDLAAIAAHGLQCGVAVAGPVEGDRLGELAKLVVHRRAQFAELGQPGRIVRHGALQDLEFGRQRIDGRLVGREVGGFAGQQEAPLAGLGILHQRQRGDDVALQFERLTRGIVVEALSLDQQRAPADEGGEHRERCDQ